MRKHALKMIAIAVLMLAMMVAIASIRWRGTEPVPRPMPRPVPVPDAMILHPPVPVEPEPVIEPAIEPAKPSPDASHSTEMPVPSAADQPPWEAPETARDDAGEILCLRQNVFWEARGEGLRGRLAVAWVTLNRVDSPKYPGTICGVVKQRLQFSWYNNGPRSIPDNVIDKREYEEIGDLAAAVVAEWTRGDRSRNPVGDAVMFHADHVSPWWRHAYVENARIGAHVFYEKES